jgi:hypothetical protein
VLTSIFEPRDEMANRTRVLKWVFPTGATLTVGGVFLYALVEHLSFESTDGWWYAILSRCFLPSLLLGTALAIVGSFIDRKRLSVAQARQE